MRKYTQLGLAIVALVSTIGLLVLERRYTHMKVFLEVADIFETSDSNRKCNQRVASIESIFEKKLLHSAQAVEATWRQISSDLYVYSALYNDTSSTVIALIMGDKSSLKLCRLRFSEDDSLEVEPKFTTLATAQPYEAVAVSCLNPNSTKVPFSVQLLTVDIPVERIVMNASGSAVCLRPVDFSVSDVQLAEYLTLHADIGIESFYLYDRSLSPSSREFALRAPFIQTELNIQLRQWNAPVFGAQSLQDTILTADCFLRSQAHSEFVAVLSLNEIFVIRMDHSNITSQLQTVLRSDELLAVHRRHFCQEYADDVVAAALNYPFVSLRKTKFSKEKGKPHQPVFAKTGDLGRLQRFLKPFKALDDKGRVAFISEESAHLNVYGKCDDNLYFIRGKNLKNTFDDVYLTSKHEVLFSSRLYKETQAHKRMEYFVVPNMT